MTSKLVYPEFPNPSHTDCVDAAMMYAYTNYQSVVDCGYGGMSMYVGGTYGVSRRNIEAAWAVGLWVMLNFERASNAYIGGASAGNAHANLGLQQATDLGWLKESPIIFSATDTNIPSGDVPTAHAYYRAMVDVFQANGAQGGAYGPPAYLRQLAAQSWWPDDFPMWQWAGAGNVEAWTWVKQVFTPVHAGISRIPFSIDENHLYKPMPVWTGYGLDPDPPEVNVTTTIFVCSDADAVFLGEVDIHGITLSVRWAGNGSDPRVQQRLNVLRQFGAPTVNTDSHSFIYSNLDGPLPAGDSRHVWTNDDFAPPVQAVPGPQGPAGPPGAQGGIGPQGITGPAGPSPKSATFTY